MRIYVDVALVPPVTAGVVDAALEAHGFEWRDGSFLYTHSAMDYPIHVSDVVSMLTGFGVLAGRVWNTDDQLVLWSPEGRFDARDVTEEGEPFVTRQRLAEIGRDRIDEVLGTDHHQALERWRQAPFLDTSPALDQWETTAPLAVLETGKTWTIGRHPDGLSGWTVPYDPVGDLQLHNVLVSTSENAWLLEPFEISVWRDQCQIRVLADTAVRRPETVTP